MPDNAFPISYAVMRKEHDNQGLNVRDEFKHLSPEDLFKETQKDRLPYAIAAINITGDWNVGVMIRSAELLGVEQFLIFGRRRYDKRTTVGAHTRIRLDKYDCLKPNSHDIDSYEFHRILKLLNYIPVFIETGGLNIKHEIMSLIPCIDIGKKPCFIFGNEGMGISQELMVGHRILSIPMRGCTNSFNVSSAMAIVAYEFSRNFSCYSV